MDTTSHPFLTDATILLAWVALCGLFAWLELRKQHRHGR